MVRAYDGDFFQDDEPNRALVAEDVLHLLEWLDNIEHCVGTERLLDHKPNNFASRATMRNRALADIESQRAYRERQAQERERFLQILHGRD